MAKARSSLNNNMSFILRTPLCEHSIDQMKCIEKKYADKKIRFSSILVENRYCHLPDVNINIPHPSWIIRCYIRDDLNTIIYLLTKAALSGIRDLPKGQFRLDKLRTDRLRRFFHNQFEAGLMDSIVAEYNGQIIGHLTWMDEDILPDRGTYIRLVDAMAVPEWEKNGVTRALMQHFLPVATELNMPVIGDVTLLRSEDWDIVKTLCSLGWVIYGAVLDTNYR
jgi:GNAT superfamily N-acetyltransferase